MSIYKRFNIAGLASATSANGTEREGATLALDRVGNGGLSVLAVSAITTASVVATFKPQVSLDGTTWYDVKLPNNASNVSTAAGTGSAVTTRLALAIPEGGLFGWAYFRCNATLSGAATAGADTTQVSYIGVGVGGIRGR